MNEFPIRGIFFDLGNVLLGLNYQRFAEKMKSLTGLGMEQLQPAFAGRLVPKYECGLLNDDEFLAGICRATGVAIPKRDFADAWTCIFSEHPLIPDELLQELAQKYQLWAISNTNKAHFEYIRARYHFLDHFRGWILSYEVGAAKPEPAIFQRALDRAGISASEALFVDDQLVNVEAARRLGMDAIHFTGVVRLAEEFRDRKIIANHG